MAWTTARERVSAAALPITYSATEGSPNEAMLILPVPTAKTVSPSNGVWVGLIARASPSSAIWAIFVAWVFVSSTFVATTAIVVFLSRPPGTAAGLDILGGGPRWIGMRLPNSSASSSGAAYRLPLASNVEPTEFTATIAPTMTPLSRTTLAVPSPPFTPPETAPAPAPTLPSGTGPDRATLHALRPKEKFGRELNGA